MIRDCRPPEEPKRQETMGTGSGYRVSHEAEGKGASYDEMYEDNRWARFLWSREQRVLECYHPRTGYQTVVMQTFHQCRRVAEAARAGTDFPCHGMFAAPGEIATVIFHVHHESANPALLCLGDILLHQRVFRNCSAAEVDTVVAQGQRV